MRPSPRWRAIAAFCCAALAPQAGAQIYTRTNAHGVLEATNVPDEGGFRLTYPGKGTLIHSRGFRSSYRGEYDRHIADAASAFNVPLDLVRAIIQVESEYDALAVSSKGAQGLMQLMPFTAQRFGVSDSFDPRQNIFGGVQYLRFLLDLFQGDVGLAAAGYNAGENAVLRHKGVPPYRETRGYVQKVQSILGGSMPMRSYAPRQVSSSSGETAPTPVLAYAPSNRLGSTRLAVSAAARAPIVPARPQVYYKWVDSQGRIHLADRPPLEEGLSYATIRAMD